MIQLLYAAGETVQEVNIGIDTGAKFIGIAITSYDIMHINDTFDIEIGGGFIMEKIVLSDLERRCINDLGDKLYTVEFLEEWLNRNDDVFANAPATFQAMGADGYYRAVKCFVELNSNQENTYKEILEHCYKAGVISDYNPRKLKELFRGG